jgi:uncharacterized UPF0160 family protein
MAYINVLSKGFIESASKVVRVDKHNYAITISDGEVSIDIMLTKKLHNFVMAIDMQINGVSYYYNHQPDDKELERIVDIFLWLSDKSRDNKSRSEDRRHESTLLTVDRLLRG